MVKAYMENGTIVAEGEDALIAHLMKEYDGSLAFREYVIYMTDTVPYNESELDAYEVLRKFPTAYRKELEYFVQEEVMGNMEAYGIVEVDYVPLTEREYRITPLNEPWTVKGADAANYYEKFADLDVGEEHRNSAYTIVRTANKKPRRKKLFTRRYRKCVTKPSMRERGVRYDLSTLPELRMLCAWQFASGMRDGIWRRCGHRSDQIHLS